MGADAGIMVTAKQKAWRKKFGMMAKQGVFKKKTSSRHRRLKYKRTNNPGMAKKKGSRKSSISRGLGGAKGIVMKAAAGVGLAVIVGMATDRFAPQFSPIAKLGAAYYGGGLPGVGAQFLLGGGSNIFQGFFGSPATQNGGAL